MSQENFSEAPEAPPEVTFWGSKCFSTAISVQKTLANAIKHLYMVGDHLALSGGLLQAPLNPLKKDVSRWPPDLSSGPGPLGPHRNLTADYIV